MNVCWTSTFLSVHWAQYWMPSMRQWDHLSIPSIHRLRKQAKLTTVHPPDSFCSLLTHTSLGSPDLKAWHSSSLSVQTAPTISSLYFRTSSWKTTANFFYLQYHHLYGECCYIFSIQSSNRLYREKNGCLGFSSRVQLPEFKYQHPCLWATVSFSVKGQQYFWGEKYHLTS